ncbi:hypothetical protein Taro_026134 [Colocasia esculenta]|uniref:Uncharacterized protein n=1 Tax=Colocasia esculenta TaxID=4460 RepID=A0A843VEC9_COLES|nr:hypothetical protein [Colocasia esculenta]
MDGNLGLTPPQDRALAGQIRGIGGGGAGGGVVELLGGAGGCRETASTMAESVPTEWTDEKHSLYLNSMEESFVNQLYNHEFCSNNLLGWTPRISKEADLPVSQIPHFCSAQFKVLHGGCWGEVEFERPQTRADIHKESRLLSRSPWIRRFMSTSNDKRLELSSAEHLGGYAADSAEIHIARQRHDDAECREATNMNQLHACCTHLCHLDFVGTNREVSDQNFVDDSEGAKRSIRVHKRKRSRTTSSNASDQAHSSGKNPATSNGVENLASPKEKGATKSVLTSKSTRDTPSYNPVTIEMKKWLLSSYF